MGKWDAFVSPRRAAMIIGVDRSLVSRWCKAAERGEPTVIATVRRESNGYLKIPLQVVLAIRDDRSTR